jgi:hypothetical protein
MLHKLPHVGRKVTPPQPTFMNDDQKCKSCIAASQSPQCLLVLRRGNSLAYKMHPQPITSQVFETIVLRDRLPLAPDQLRSSHAPQSTNMPFSEQKVQCPCEVELRMDMSGSRSHRMPQEVTARLDTVTLCCQSDRYLV